MAPVYGAAYSGGATSGGSPPRASLARAESPPPLPFQEDMSMIGQAVEMDHMTGSPANTPGFIPPPHPFRDSDSDVQGLVGMQQARSSPAPAPLSPTSQYSSSQRTASYAPSHWGTGARHGTPPLQTIQASPAMVGDMAFASRQSPNIQQAPAHNPQQARVSGDNYYEDVDPRFQEEPPLVPSALMPGRQMPGGFSGASSPTGRHHPLEASASYDSVNDGPASDQSNFTSISQRGVNPQWRPEQDRQDYGYGGVPNRNPPQQQQQQPQKDFLLAGNPDFELGPGRGGRGAGGRGGRGGNMMGSGMI